MSKQVNAPDGHKKLVVNLPEEMHKTLKMLSVSRDGNMTDIVVRLIEKELIKYEKKAKEM
jgi:hypothetical protein